MQDDPRYHSMTLCRDLAAAVAAARGELGSMPFFVRPMVKRGFRKRTGRTMEEWESLCRRISTQLESSKDVLDEPGLIADLERLKENFRTAPERARRGMGDNPTALATVRERSAERVELIDDLIHALAALGLG